MSYLLLTLTTLFWSGNFVVSRGMHAAIPPLALSFWRWVLALVILLIFAGRYFVEERESIRENWKFIAVQGVLGVGLFNTLVYLAVQSTTAINAVLVNSCIPVLIAVVSWVMYREVMSVRQCFGVLLSLCGVLLIIVKGDMSALLEVRFNKGDLFILAAAMVWATYSANLKRFPQGMHPLAFLIGIVFAGLCFITPFYLLELGSGKGFVVTSSTLLTIVYVALFASVLAFIFWNKAVRKVGANKAGPFIHLMPLFSTILAVVFLGEQLALYHFKGAALIFTGIVLTTMKSRVSKS